MPSHQELYLRPHFGRVASGDRAAYALMLREVLGIDGAAPVDGPWRSFALFSPTGACAAVVEAAILPLMLDGALGDAAAIRSVAVAPAWRGRGLFRRLIREALAWCDASTSGPAFLYTEEPALYERFGFRQIAQHAFVGAAPMPVPSEKGRPLDLGDPADLRLIRTRLADRAAVSAQTTLCVDPDQLLANLVKDEGWRASALADALIVHEEGDGEVVVVDVIAPRIPDLAILLGACGCRAERVKTLFPPDRLAWRGTPVPEDTGLMIRGATPAALERPFMFPPTAEF